MREKESVHEMPWIKVVVFAVSLSGLVIWASRAIVPEEGQVPHQVEGSGAHQAAATYGGGEADIATRIWKAYKKKNPIHCFWAEGTGLQVVLAYAKYRIGVTAEQDPEWQAFRKGVTKAGPTLAEVCQALKAQGATAPPRNWDELGDLADPMREQGALLGPKFEALYAVLTEEQRDRLNAMIGRKRERR